MIKNKCKVKKKKVAKRTVSKKRKVRKNPYFDKGYVSLLSSAFRKGGLEQLSHTISYGATGYQCSDCEKLFWQCTCEGSRERPGYPCEDCKQKRCVCDLNVWNDKGNLVPDKVRKEAWRIARETLGSEANDLIYYTFKYEKDPNSKLINDVENEYVLWLKKNKDGFLNEHFLKKIDKIVKSYKI